LGECRAPGKHSGQQANGHHRHRSCAHRSILSRSGAAPHQHTTGMSFGLVDPSGRLSNFTFLSRRQENRTSRMSMATSSGYGMGRESGPRR
jgi:hypothetical protein